MEPVTLTILLIASGILVAVTLLTALWKRICDFWQDCAYEWVENKFGVATRERLADVIAFINKPVSRLRKAALKLWSQIKKCIVFYRTRYRKVGRDINVEEELAFGGMEVIVQKRVIPRSMIYDKNEGVDVDILTEIHCSTKNECEIDNVEIIDKKFAEADVRLGIATVAV